MPKKNAAFVFGLGLPSQANSALMQVDPTLASGDVQISKDGGAFANLANLPAVTPAGGKRVEVSLTSTEMNADNITIQFSDQVGDEWSDVMVGIQTTASTIDEVATAVADLPTNSELATALGTADDAVLASIAALNNLSAAQVNAEVDTAIADAFTFTVAGQVDANIQYVNDVAVTGNGEAGTEWGPA